MIKFIVTLLLTYLFITSLHLSCEERIVLDPNGDVKKIDECYVVRNK